MAAYAYMSQPDPEFAPHVDTFTAMRPSFDVATRRKLFKTVFHEVGNKTYGPRVPKESLYAVTDHHIEVEAGVTILARSVVPTSQEDPKRSYPLLVWVHGGGWVSGDVETDDLPLRAISHDVQMSVLNVEYRLAPENRHPTQVNDAFEAIKWAAENAPLLRADLKKGFILGGLSAGGHLTAVLAHRVRDDPFFKDRPVTGHVIQFPAVLHPDAYPEEYKDRLLSYQQNKNAPILSWESVVWLWHQFLDGTGISPSDPEVSPLLYPSHEGLSPVIIQVAGLDPLRDEALLYDQVLRKAGVKTRTITYPGVPHGFNYVFGSMKAASKFEEDYRDGLRWLLASADN